MKDPHDLLPLSALQHLLYCDRQCALIHVERVWAENRLTAEGRVLHEKAHEGKGESRPGVRIARGLPVASTNLGLTGYCDVVEFHKDGTVVPIEYKRGKPKAHRADEVQLAAQAIALEEMLAVSIPTGLLFYGKTRRRQPVILDTELRALTTSLAERLQQLLSEGRTPPPVYEAPKCDSCSLLQLCLPRANHRARGAAAWFSKQLDSP